MKIQTDARTHRERGCNKRFLFDSLRYSEGPDKSVKIDFGGFVYSVCKCVYCHYTVTHINTYPVLRRIQVKRVNCLKRDFHHLK